MTPTTQREQVAPVAIGVRQRKVDGEAKASGATQFTDDIQLARMLHAKIKRSTRPHARIVRIETEEAKALTGVLAVITGQDMPHTYGVIPWTKDEYPLCLDKVRYVGDAVAAVAAVDEETANAALKRIKVVYEDLPAILDTDTAQSCDTKIHAFAKVGNVTKHVALSFGDVDEGFRNSAVMAEGEFYFQGTTHAPIEPHCAIAEFSARGVLTVYSATQVPHYLHRSLSEVLELDSDRIRVIQPAVGGAFGGKSEPFDLEFVVAKLAMITGRPVKCLYTREEVFLAHRGRHPMRMRFKTGADSQGILKAVESQIDIDGGAYASFGMITAFYAGQLLTGPVNFDSYRFEATRYYTNKPACGPKRGHGSVQPRFAFEVQLDEIAEQLGIDPIDLRLRNALPAHSTTVNGQKVGSLGLADCLKAVEEASGWRKRRGQLPFGRGLGVATSMYISGTNYPVYPNDMPQSALVLRADRSGRVSIQTGASDIGQGSDSMVATIVCEELGLDRESVRVKSGDTDLCPVDLGAYSSRVTLMMGLAAQEAARKLRHQLQTCVAKLWQIDAKSILMAHGRIYYAHDTSKSLAFKDAVALLEAQQGTLVTSGSYRTTPRGGDYRGGTIGASPAYSCSAHVADVSVDSNTGKILIHKIWAAHDCGQAINPVLVEGQIEGSTYMGCAEVALENMLYGVGARQGMLIGPSLLDYRIPTSLDTPDIQALIVENPDPNGPYGAKEAGEGPLHSSIPAVVNAIYDAVGLRFYELPLTPAKIRQALAAKTIPQRG